MSIHIIKSALLGLLVTSVTLGLAHQPAFGEVAQSGPVPPGPSAPPAPGSSTIGGGGGGPGGAGGGGVLAADQAAVDAQVLRSFTANPVSVQPGQSTRVDWVVEGPADVLLKVDGYDAARSGLRFVPVAGRDQKVSIVASKGSASRTLGTLNVGVNPCVGTGQHPSQCLRAGRVVFDYHRAREDFAFEGKKLTTPISNGALTFDACSTDPGRHGRIERYSLVLRQLGHLPERISRDVCRFPVRLGGGVWGGVLQARAADGVVLSAPVSVRVHDRFVVSLGDSMASGEGNPDVRGNYIGFPWAKAHWQHGACHRSAVSGHVRAAKELSKDPHTGLVFLSLACTGAEIGNVWYARQGAQQPQLDALKAAVCRYRCNQPIDALFLTVGVNDLRFADIVKNCSILRRGSSCDHSLRVGRQKVWGINDQLRRIKMGLAGRGLVVRRLVITEYPINLFDGGCAIRRGKIQELGGLLNAEIRAAVSENRASGWVYAGGVVSAFRGHSFCKHGSASWFRSLKTSLDHQGDKLGTAHPTAPGHRAIGARILAAYRASLPSEPVIKG